MLSAALDSSGVLLSYTIITYITPNQYNYYLHSLKHTNINIKHENIHIYPQDLPSYTVLPYVLQLLVALLTGVGADAAVSLYGLCLEGEYYVTLLPYSISSGALESSDLLPPYSVITVALHITIILIIIHLSNSNP